MKQRSLQEERMQKHRGAADVWALLREVSAVAKLEIPNYLPLYREMKSIKIGDKEIFLKRKPNFPFLKILSNYFLSYEWIHP